MCHWNSRSVNRHEDDLTFALTTMEIPTRPLKTLHVSRLPPPSNRSDHQLTTSVFLPPNPHSSLNHQPTFYSLPIHSGKTPPPSPHLYLCFCDTLVSNASLLSLLPYFPSTPLTYTYITLQTEPLTILTIVKTLAARL